MHELAPIILDLAVILGVAGIVTLLFQKIQQPVVLGYLVAGMILGPYTPPHTLVSDIPHIKVIAELGVIFLMFSLGLGFSFHKLTKVGFSASVTGTIEVVMMTVLGFFMGRIIGWSYYDSLFLGSALAISSTTIIIKALEELNLTRKRFADVVFGILIVEDLLAILLLVALSTVVITQNIFSLSMLLAIAKLITVVVGWFLIGYFLVPHLFRNITKFANSETLTIVSIALCLLLVTVAAYFHYSTALGAFIMGSILAETAQISRIKKLIQPIRDIFAAVFFVSIGMLINPTVIVSNWAIVLFISVITILGKILTSGVGAFLTGQGFKNSLRIGFSMAQIGEFSFIIVGLGITLGVITDKLYAIIVAVSAITTFTTPYLIQLSSFISTLFDRHASDKTKRLFDNYSAWVYRTLSGSQNQSANRHGIVRFLINSIVVAIIFTFVQFILLPHIKGLIDSRVYIAILGWIISFMLASPFIWAMLFSFRIKPSDKFKKISVLTFIAWMFAFLELSYLSMRYFYSWPTAVFLLIVASGFLGIFAQRIAKSYHWFEKQLVANLGSPSEEDMKLQKLAPWDRHLVHLTISPNSSVVGKTLAELQFRNEYGMNIVAVGRGNKVFFAPRGDQMLMPDDKIVVLGNDEQLDKVRVVVESELNTDQVDILENVSLKSYFINEQHPYIGKTIRDTKIREKMNGIVVGIERKDRHILNPDSSVIMLEENDLLLILIR